MIVSLCFISFTLLFTGVVLILGINVYVIEKDVVAMLSPRLTLRERAEAVRGKKRHRVSAMILHFRDALSAGSGSRGFGIFCASSIILAIAGIIAGILMKNYFLIPVLMAAGLVIPFFFANRAIESYDRQVRDELEVSLSVITSTYIRTGDIVKSVKDNLGNIKPPVREKFRNFCTKTAVISSNVTKAIEELRDSFDNSVFFEWCEALIACQEDFSNADTLVPIVERLTEIRLVNNELRTKIESCRREYWTMVIIVLSNIPLLRMINEDWFNALMKTLSGQLSLALCGVTIIVTSLFMIKFTRPLDYSANIYD